MPSADPQRVPFDPFNGSKTTFNSLSELIVSETTRAQENGRYGPEALDKLTDALFSAPRLTQWHPTPQGNSDTEAWQLWTKDDLMYVTVTEEDVHVTKGIRNFHVIKGLQAETLHKAITTAQEILRPVQPIPEAEAEEFFGGPDDDAKHEDLDAALADSPAGEAVHDGNPYLSNDPDDAEELTGIMAEVVEAAQGEDASFTVERNLEASLETAETVEEFEGNPDQAFEPQPIKRNTVAVKDQPKFPGYIRCSYCGGLNPHAYKGACPQCPKHSSVMRAPKVDKESKTWQAAQERKADRELKRLQSLQGRVLNIVEASLGDKEQRGAVKTLINKEFRRTLSLIVPGSEEVEE
jgi:hypothetical protein